MSTTIPPGRVTYAPLVYRARGAPRPPLCHCSNESVALAIRIRDDNAPPMEGYVCLDCLCDTATSLGCRRAETVTYLNECIDALCRLLTEHKITIPLPPI